MDSDKLLCGFSAKIKYNKAHFLNYDNELYYNTHELECVIQSYIKKNSTFTCVI